MFFFGMWVIWYLNKLNQCHHKTPSFYNSQIYNYNEIVFSISDVIMWLFTTQWLCHHFEGKAICMNKNIQINIGKYNKIICNQTLWENYVHINTVNVI